MKYETITSHEDLGARVASTRLAAGLTQAQLAQQIGLDRTVLSKIEGGTRRLDAVELAAIAEALGRSVGFFLMQPVAVHSHREGSAIPQEVEPQVEALVFDLSRDVQLLLDLGELRPRPRPSLHQRAPGLDDVETLAAQVRQALGEPDAPLLGLQRICESLALYSVSVEAGTVMPEGVYQSLGDVGVAWIRGEHPPGRRRFTLAHELGHHLLEDEFRIDWSFGSDETERIVNAFAIHLLMPRTGVTRRWEALRAQEHDHRSCAIILAAEYGVSWSAACAQLQRFGLLDDAQYDAARTEPPRRGDLLALELSIPEELTPPAISPGLSAAVLRAYRHSKIGAGRAIEMLRGTLAESELPEPAAVPLAAFAGELDPLG